MFTLSYLSDRHLTGNLYRKPHGPFKHRLDFSMWKLTKDLVFYREMPLAIMPDWGHLVMRREARPLCGHSWWACVQELVKLLKKRRWSSWRQVVHAQKLFHILHANLSWLTYNCNPSIEQRTSRTCMTISAASDWYVHVQDVRTDLTLLRR